MTLVARIKPRAQREIERAAEWWAENRPAAPGAIRKDVEAALALLVEEPGIGTQVKTARSDIVRSYTSPEFATSVYYHVSGQFLDVVAFWHASREAGPSL